MDSRIVDFYRHYHKKVIVRPTLYRSGNYTIDVILPNNLLEYANAASGHSGFGAGARARGIRQETSNAADSLAEIFSSPESLLQFLNSSEQNADPYIDAIRNRHVGTVKIKKAASVKVTSLLDPKASEAFHSKYDYTVMKQLVSKFSKEIVKEAYDVLTMWEFESRFGL